MLIDWYERATDYYFEFRWWKYLVVFLAGLGIGNLTAWPAHGQQQGQITCSQMATSTAGFTTKVQIIAAPGTGTSRIFICGFIVSAVAASVVTFQTGTGTNCATNSTAIGPTIQLGATSTVVDSSSFFRGFQVSNPNALCVTGTTAADMVIFWERQ